ncbi:GntR family transcriptional regulator [Arthrobacter sp. JUb119]|uniref:GntR family transcriptional regulator n=1 Tax=Arthrobacter sp. JUb115 TaxID=2485108 RepID=UPI00105DA6F5|nr:GntR family transcriptional regulator [Arthrobacter sp. JUb115]MCS3494427.1 GntR family transcriptional regulator [Arthrobacter sp. JUb119]TDU22520.1 GntR family transcriptional regulator [Arthrobacter sp. JUb115]
MTITIDRSSPVPYYEQLLGILREHIVEGKYPQGEKLPSELELSRDYGLARATVRQTLLKLENEGYARKVARRGVFATLPPAPSGWIVQDTEGFLESQMQHGRTGIETHVISSGFVVPAEHVTQALGLPAHEQVYFIERSRTLDQEPALYSVNWFPAEIGTLIAKDRAVLDGTGSVNAALRREGLNIAGAKRVIHALPATEVVAKHLRVSIGFPVLRICSQSWDSSHGVFDYFETWVRTDTVPLEVNVTAAA